MFEMLTGKHPFQTQSNSFGTWYQAHRFQTPPTFEEINSQIKVPQELQKLVMNCLAKEVSDRPQNISQILEKLEQVKHRLNDHSWQTSSPVQLVPVTSVSEKECLQKTWPKNKPIAPIGFPHLLHTTQGTVATIWAMLPQEEISKFLNKTHGTEFIAKMNIYPMLLWVTVLYDAQLSLTRWLSYFLDIKDHRGQKIVRVLADTGYYHLLFFALEEPTRCAHVMTLTFTGNQRQQLADYLATNQKLNELISPEQAKNIIKVEYEKVKLEIRQNLAVNPQIAKAGFKDWVSKLFERFLQILARN